MSDVTEISPIEAAEAVGLTVFEFDVYLRDQAASRLESLAADIRRGHESARGDVDREEYDGIAAGVWRVVESAQASRCVAGSPVGARPGRVEVAADSRDAHSQKEPS